MHYSVILASRDCTRLQHTRPVAYCLSPCGRVAVVSLGALCSDSDEAARDSGEAGSDAHQRPQLVRAAGVRHHRRRPVRGPHVAHVQPQVVRRRAAAPRYTAGARRRHSSAADGARRHRAAGGTPAPTAYPRAGPPPPPPALRRWTGWLCSMCRCHSDSGKSLYYLN